MEKICLVEAGEYLLGIDAATVIRQMDVNSFMDEEQEDEPSLISLASFFNQNTAVDCQAKSFVVEVKSSGKPLVLLVDRLVDELEGAVHFQSLPLLYPEFARRCCPRIMLHKDQPVLLLDVAGMEVIHAMLENDCGVISYKSLCERVVGPGQPAPQIDDSSFNNIVSWAIDKYLTCDNAFECSINIEELPAELAQSIQVQGVSNELLQHSVDKIVQKCGEFHDAALQQLRATKIGTQQ